MGRWVVFALALLGQPQPALAGELLVAAAASLREPVQEICHRFEEARPGARVQLALGASSALAAQIRAGAPVDLFLSADARIVDALVGEGLVAAGAHAALAGNRLVVLAAPGVPPPRRARDLLRPELRRIAVAPEAVPVGHYARRWLEGRGLLAPLAPRLVATEHARATLAAVEQGHVQAAVVYATDARLARAAQWAFAVPPEEHPPIVYAAALLRAGQAAEALFAHLLGPESRALLAAAGFPAP